MRKRRTAIKNRIGRIRQHIRQQAVKLKEDHAGMTFAELLIAVMILMLVGTGMVSVIGFGADQYDKTLRQSQALVLCSTISTVLEHELAYTTQINTDADGNLVSYASPDYAMEKSLSSIMTDDSGSNGYGRIILANRLNKQEYRSLLSDAAYTKGLLAKVTDITYDSTTKYVTLTVHVGYQGEDRVSRTFQVKNRNMGS